MAELPPNEREAEVLLDQVIAHEMEASAFLAKRIAKNQSYDAFVEDLKAASLVFGKEAVKAALPFLMAALASAL